MRQTCRGSLYQHTALGGQKNGLVSKTIRLGQNEFRELAFKSLILQQSLNSTDVAILAPT
jgi:hypothetical protein